MAHLPPQWIETDATLRQQGLCIVPIEATAAMKAAAANAMRLRKERMGNEWFIVGVKTKAGLRWKAMLEAWHARQP